MKIIDLSTDIRAGMPKPPSAPEVTMKYVIEQSREQEEEKGYSNKLEQFTITTHVATHFDAPSHFTTTGKNIDELSLEMFCMVPTVVLDVEKDDYGKVTAEDLEEAEKKYGAIEKGDLVILNTGFWRWYEEEKYLRTPYLEEEAARYLADAGASMVGIDCFTVDDVREKQKPAHVLLLKERGIPIIECVANLGGLPSHRFRSICLPLNIKDGSGAFTRLVGVFEEREGG